MNRRFLPGCLLAAFLLSNARVWGDAVDDYLKTEMEKHRVPGLALMVVEDGKVTKSQGYGFSNLEVSSPATADTVFEIGSITKQFTAGGILLLAQDGKLSVDDKISKHLKNIPDAWTNVTIRHLLTHTSGIRNYTVLDGFELRQHLTQEKFIKAMSNVPMDFQPGDSWKYCNTGFNLLGFIIENVSGKNYWDFMSERIFQPLGMNSTTNRTPSVLIPHRASGYEQKNHKHINRDYDLTDIFSAGAIVSTVGDLAKWDAALDGDQLFTAATKDMMWTPVKLNDGKIHEYGFGWFLSPLDGHKNIGHSGSTSGFSASNQRFPDDKLIVIVLTNTDEGVATDFAKHIATMYFGPKEGTK